MTAPNKVDSNTTSLAIAVETSLKVLPGTPIWQSMEPNSYSDFYGSFTNTNRTPINPDRYIKKGVITDLDAKGGFNIDFMESNLQTLLMGFVFADALEKPDTASLSAAAIPITSVVASTKTFAAASGLGSFKANHIVWNSGFTNALNNGLDIVASATATTIVETATKTDEATPPAGANIEVVGFQFPSADASISAVSATGVTFATVATDLTTLGLSVGEWVFLGGDGANSKFATCPTGYARIASIAAHAIVFNDTTFVPVVDAGTGKLIQLFFGKVIKNQPYANIKRRTFQLERQIGNDGNGVQTEYLLGAVPDQLTLNIPNSGKLNTDLTFVAMDYQTQTGTVGPKAGTRVAAVNENAYNTSSDIYRQKISIYDPLNINNAALFAYASDGKIVINNNVKSSKAIGVLGAFDATVGDFTVTGTLTAYFSTVAAVSAIRANSDIGFSSIAAHKNMGFIVDIPLLSLSDGKLTISKDSPVNLGISMNAAQSTLGSTILFNFFTYLPTVAMPS